MDYVEIPVKVTYDRKTGQKISEEIARIPRAVMEESFMGLINDIISSKRSEN